MNFDEWIDFGIKNGFCSEQFCERHGSIPMTELEERLLDIDADLCVHVVRLGSEKWWDADADAYMIEQLPASR